MVCLGQNGHFTRKVPKYAAVWQCPALPHQIGALRPKAPQYAAARQHSGAYPATFAPLRMHRLNRTFAWCASVKTGAPEKHDLTLLDSQNILLNLESTDKACGTPSKCLI